MRKPVRSVVADRKYFQGGGLTKNTNPMAVSQPSGIMASSQPLVDMVANSANNPQGGMSPLNYADGGLAKFEPGGVFEDAKMRGERERSIDGGLMGGSDPRRNIKVPTLINLNANQFNELTQPTMDIPEGESRIGQFFKTRFNLPIQSPLKGIGQFFFSKKMRQDFPTATPEQLQDINAIVRMNPERENEIYEGAKKLITEQGFKGSGDNLRKALIPILPKSLESEKLLDEKFDKEAEEANQKAREEAEGKAPEIDPITPEQEKASNELIEGEKIDSTFESTPGKDASDKDIKTEEFTFPFAKQEKTSVVKKSEDVQTAEDLKNITESEEGVNAILDKTNQKPVDQSEEAKTAMDETIQNINKNAEEGNQEETTRSIEDYTEEFKKAMPKFEGMTEEEKGFAIMEAGLAIMGGQSPRALENISNGLQPLVKKFAKNKEQERAYGQQINIAAAKYGIQKSDADRAREMALADAIAAEGRAFAPGRVVLKPFTFKGKKYGEKDVFEFTRADMETEEFKNIPAGTLASESVYKEIMTNKRNADDNVALIEKAFYDSEVAKLKDGVELKQFRTDMTEYRNSNKVFYEGMNQRVILGQATQLFVDDPEAILGAKGYVADVLDRTLSFAGIKTTRGELAELAAKPNKQMFNAKMREIGTKMLTQILNEGTKTVSDADRVRVEKLVSEITDLAAASANPEVIKMKLLSLDKAIAKGIRNSNTSMKQIENRYTKDVRIKGLPKLVTTEEIDIIKKGQQDPDFVSGSEGQEFNYTDIWDPNADKGQGNFIGEFKV